MGNCITHGMVRNTKAYGAQRNMAAQQQRTWQQVVSAQVRVRLQLPNLALPQRL